MTLPKPLEQLGSALVREVRDPHLDLMQSILEGADESIDGKQLAARLRAAGVTSTQVDAIIAAMKFSTDTLLASVLSFAEYHITRKELFITVADRASGDQYGIEDTDMLASAYFGTGSWVDKYSRRP
jgi:hypothetical protein